MFPGLGACSPTDLTAIADAVATLPSGRDALLSTAARVAEFTSATPSYGHEVLAFLMLEGLLDVLTTNWDDCIERGGGEERVLGSTQQQLPCSERTSIVRLG
jgi:NAD-dependent SIR2 family protein deacetylase